MWKLPLPSVDGVRAHLTSAFTYIIDRDPLYELTDDEFVAVSALYERYDALFGRPTDELKGLLQLSAEFRAAIRNAYEEVKDGGRLSGLRDTLKLNATECPMCGFGSIQDLDHHLPKVDYLPLSIYPRNLVPSCTTCNKKKFTAAPDDAERQFLHVYLEQVPALSFLVARAELGAAPAGLIVTFEIVRCAGMSDEMFVRLKSQFDRLDLNNRYAKQVNIHLSSQLASFTMTFERRGRADDVRELLSATATSNQRIFGLNDWRTALMNGLAACDRFCDGGFSYALGQRIVAGA